MKQNCWGIWPDRGFLLNPDPTACLSDIVGLDTLIPRDALIHLDQISLELPSLLDSRKVRATLDTLPVYDVQPLRQYPHFQVVERFMQLYSYLASAYVYATHETPEHRIPAGVAKPLYQLSQMVERPPIITYSSYVLSNWMRPAAQSYIRVDDLELAQNFLGVEDERWFILIHVDIEARAAGALQGIQAAVRAANENNPAVLEQALEEITISLRAMQATFDRMPEHCNSDVYYFRVRPYIFGFNDVIYEGVEAYGGKPQSFRGQTGAQSSIIPALVAGLGLRHEQTGLTQHLDIMKDYMPKPHREFVAQMSQSRVRECVVTNAHHGTLAEVYNECLRQMLAFRRLHLHYATTYIAQKVANPVGTGGTLFMDWLAQLVRETEDQLV
jgi:indoleamine 2,3-dioxygenase